MIYDTDIAADTACAFNEFKEKVNTTLNTPISNEAIATLFLTTILDRMEFDLNWIVRAIAKVEGLEPNIAPE